MANQEGTHVPKLCRVEGGLWPTQEEGDHRRPELAQILMLEKKVSVMSIS